MTPTDMAKLLSQAVERARLRPEYLGWALARFAKIEEITEETLRGRLKISVGDWHGLQLCLRPRPDKFLADVTQLASRFNIDRAAMAAILRRVDAIIVVQKGRGTYAPGKLLAARTRRKQKPRGPKETTNE